MRKRKLIPLFIMLFGISWIIYNYFVTTPAHNVKMSCYDAKLKLLDQASLALDQGNQELAHQYQLEADSITGC
jgi:hypothetical protein